VITKLSIQLETTKRQHMLENYITIGRPIIHDFAKLVENHVLTNCPIIRRDIDSVHNIFEPDTEGKTTQSPLGHAKSRHQ